MIADRLRADRSVRKDAVETIVIIVVGVAVLTAGLARLYFFWRQ